MKNRLYAALRLIVMLLIISQIMQCRKDETTTNVIDSTLVMDHEDVSFLITVVDEDHKLLEETTMSIADDAQIYMPNDNGIYIIDKIDVPDIGRKVTVTKQGYYPQIKMLSGRSQSKNIMEVIMIKEAAGVTISTGSTGTIDGNGTLRLPSTLSDGNGSTYSGPVKVQSHYYDPDDANYIQQAPGNMLGLTTEDEYVLLGSLGMYLIELTNPDNGEALNIPQGSTARISFPIADSQAGDVPSSIPLWSMDEDLGIWIYEGEASLVGDMMVADVSHFSWWNCDLPYDFLPFCATFVTLSGETVNGLHVNASVNNQGFGNDVTDDEGMIRGKLPKDEIVNFKFNYNNEEYGNTQIGPFVDVPIDITVEVPELPVVTGIAVDCNQMAIVDGYGLVTSTNGTFPIYLDSDGSFKYLLAQEDHSLLLVDRTTNEFENVEVTASTEAIDLGEIELCNQLNVGRIYGKVMLDEDEDGISDTPIVGAIIKVRNITTGQIDYTINSDIDGVYSVMIIPNVEYELFIEETADWKVMYQGDLTPEDNLDNEEWTNKTREGVGISAILQDAMEIDEDNDFQLVQKGMGEVRGRVMRDLDGDNIGDVGLENYLVSIISYTQGTEKETTVMTDSNGEYSLMMPNFIGDVKIDETSVSDFDLSPDPDGDDSDLGANSEIPIRVKTGEIDEGNEFLMIFSTISGSALEDVDGDGIGDVEILNLSVVLYDNNLVQISNSLIESGAYEFDLLLPGDYIVRLFKNNAQFVFHHTNSQDATNDDLIDELDEDPMAGSISDSQIPIELDVLENDADNNFVLQRTSELISGNVEEDTDNDGTGDTPIEGLTITLADVAGAVISTTVSDSDGYYEFGNLLPGNYIVSQQEETELDEDYIDVYDGDDSPEDANDAVDGLKDDIIYVTLEDGEFDEDNNFVEIQHGSISGNVSIDTDNDDVGDAPNEGQTITLIDVDSGEMYTQLSDTNGDYKFEGLAPGEFTVTYTTPAGFITVFDGDETSEDADDAVDALNDGSIEITLLPGEDDDDNNFVDRPN